MSTDNRDVLEVLKAELNFIEKGGYGKPAGEPWVSTSIFQDSPSCINLGDPARTHPCSECLLTDLVPPEDRSQDVPCHHIRLTETGETVADIEGRENQQELEQKVKSWLKRTISRIEQERAAIQAVR
ncbi:MAG TPA: hypothetical protein VLE20_15630 [Blastocatellia bacterium]|nr:hypothetical protein [Blastocatellia bacterium]